MSHQGRGRGRGRGGRGRGRGGRGRGATQENRFQGVGRGQFTFRGKLATQRKQLQRVEVDKSLTRAQM